MLTVLRKCRRDLTRYFKVLVAWGFVGASVNVLGGFAKAETFDGDVQPFLKTYCRLGTTLKSYYWQFSS